MSDVETDQTNDLYGYGRSTIRDLSAYVHAAEYALCLIIRMPPSKITRYLATVRRGT